MLVHKRFLADSHAIIWCFSVYDVCAYSEPVLEAGSYVEPRPRKPAKTASLRKEVTYKQGRISLKHYKCIGICLFFMRLNSHQDYKEWFSQSSTSPFCYLVPGSAV